MKITSLHRRWTVAVIASALVTAGTVGCATMSEPASDNTSRGLEGDLAERTAEATQARDALVQVVQAAATVAAGSEVKPYLDTVSNCSSDASQAQFAITATVPFNGDIASTIDRVATRWADFGIELTPEGNATYTNDVWRAGGNRQVFHARITYFEASGQHPAHYDIGGFSRCVPGPYEDYLALLGE